MLRGQHVLIIEDEPLIALDLEQALSSAGAVVNIANTVASALDAAEASSVTAAIIDLRLHGRRSAMPLSGSLHEIFPLSSIPVRPKRTRRASWPGVPLLLKPLPPKEVVEMLARVVAVKAGGISIPSKKGGPV